MIMGSSRPRRSRTAATASGLALGPSIMRAGSPGVSLTSKKLMMLMPISTGTSCASRREIQASLLTRRYFRPLKPP